MSTPGSVEFDKNVLVIVNDDFVEGFSNDHLNWLVIVLRNILTLEVFDELSSLEVLDEFNNVSLIDLTALKLVFGDLSSNSN